MNPIEGKINRAFQKLAVDIIPSDELLKKTRDCADKIIKLIQEKSDFKVGHVCIAGSTGKKTTIVNSDIDCVLFINDELPRFQDVLEEWEDIFYMTDSYNIRDVRKTKYSIQFKALGLDFDILPAANFTVGSRAGKDKLIDIQQQRTLAYIQKDPKKYVYAYSSSLANAAVRFMKRQNGFVHEMVRIAKFWYKTLHFNDYISGAKSCIEFIAVYAANEGDSMETNSHLKCFERFIGHLQNFHQLNVHFEENEHRIFDKIRPRVIDPVNPYNNLAKNWDRKSIELLKGYANETKQRLHILATDTSTDGLDQLFEPQPMYRTDLCDIFEGSDWLIGWTTTIPLLPDLKIRKERFGTDRKLRNGLEVFKSNFQTVICTVRASEFDENKIQKVLENSISKQIDNTEWSWDEAEGEHEDYDVTFTLPFTKQKAIRISYRL